MYTIIYYIYTPPHIYIYVYNSKRCTTSYYFGIAFYNYLNFIEKLLINPEDPNYVFTNYYIRSFYAQKNLMRYIYIYMITILYQYRIEVVCQDLT